MVADTARDYNAGMRILVIGGHGHLGSRVVRALRGMGALEVVPAGRRARAPGDVQIDLLRPESFTALEGFDLAINASSSHVAAPDALAHACLARGSCLLETSSDRLVMQRLLALRHGARADRGTLVLGAGIFTGLSNLLGAAAVRGMGEPDELVLGVRSSPFSGSGAGTVDLMLDSLATPACTVVAGQCQERGSVERGPVWTIDGARQRSLLVPLSEPAMLNASQGVPNASMYLLPKPNWLARAFLLVPSWLARQRFYRAWIWLQFTFLRRWLLRSRPTRVELFARARAGQGARASTFALSAPDGMWTAGVAVAAMAHLLAMQSHAAGVYCIDEVLDLAQVIRHMRAFDPGCVIYTTDARVEVEPDGALAH
jgi:hypothetical protein